MERFYGELGRRIREARKSFDQGRGLTQLELAQLIGLSRSSIANIERGDQQPPVHVFVQIAEALNRSPETLLPGVEKSERASLVQALQGRELRSEEIDRVADLLLAGEGAYEDD